MNNNNKKVYVGMSGGVDSSASAYLLKEAGYDVIGVFIKVWQPEGIECTWKEDRLDAMRVAAQLDIPFITIDLEKEYKQGVIDYMIDEYRNGRTPNPDVMCNKHVKFGAFYSWAIANGADYVATGHYVQNIWNDELKCFELRASKDTAKDQGYFLWTLTQEKLSRVLFPIGHLEKSEVREVAHSADLYTKDKNDSQGLCFIGKLDFKAFLKEYIDEQNGNVLDESGTIIGHHTGSTFLTLGERHGFTIDNKSTNDKPYYIVSKNHEENTVTVSQEIERVLHSDFVLTCTETNWISKVPEVGNEYSIKVRHGQGSMRAICSMFDDASVSFEIHNGDNTAGKGQSVVVFDGDVLIGGGIII